LTGKGEDSGRRQGVEGIGSVERGGCAPLRLYFFTMFGGGVAVLDYERARSGHGGGFGLVGKKTSRALRCVGQVLPTKPLLKRRPARQTRHKPFGKLSPLKFTREKFLKGSELNDQPQRRGGKGKKRMTAKGAAARNEAKLSSPMPSGLWHGRAGAGESHACAGESGGQKRRKKAKTSDRRSHLRGCHTVFQKETTRTRIVTPSEHFIERRNTTYQSK